jgi:hypothetical protein
VRLDEAVAQQPVVHRHDRRAGNGQTSGELAGGGETIPGPQASVEDRRPELAVDLPRQLPPPDEADLDVDWQGWMWRDWLSHQSTAHRRVETMNCAAAFEITQRLDMESFARYDVEAFRRVHHPEAIAILPNGTVARGIDSIIDTLADHFAGREAVYTWRELHRFVDSCRAAFVLYETVYEIPSTGRRQHALTGVTYVYEGGHWLAIADQGSVVEPSRLELGTAARGQAGVRR